MYKSILTVFAVSVLSAYGFAAVTETNPIETSEGFISAVAPPPAPVLTLLFTLQRVVVMLPLHRPQLYHYWDRSCSKLK